jgi:epsilon-lactone hydrolase
MPSWQASTLNLILAYWIKPALRLGKAGLSMARSRTCLRRLDALLPWPRGLVSETGTSGAELLLKYRCEPPLESTTGTLFYIRGGGFCFETPHTHARLLAPLARACHLDVAVANYRLAPEYPFPCAPYDVLKAYLRLLEDRPAHELILMGDSAGGNLALCLLQELKRLGLALPRACVLLSPALDLDRAEGDFPTGIDDPLFTPRTLGRLRDSYLAGADASSVRASPLLGDMEGLPPMLVISGTRELLLADAERLQQKILAVKGQIRLSRYPGLPHAFVLCEALPEARQAREEVIEFVRLSLAG